MHRYHSPKQRPNLRVVDLVAKVAGVSLKRTFYTLVGVRDGDAAAQHQFGKRTLQQVLDAHKTVSIFLGGDTSIRTIVPGATILPPTPEQVVACAEAYRDMVDLEYV